MSNKRSEAKIITFFYIGNYGDRKKFKIENNEYSTSLFLYVGESGVNDGIFLRNNFKGSENELFAAADKYYDKKLGEGVK